MDVMRSRGVFWTLLTLSAALALPGLAASSPGVPVDGSELAQRGELILWTLPAELTAAPGAERSQVDVEIYSDGVLLHHEQMDVQRPTPGKVGVVQLLARRPLQRQALVGIARRGKIDLEARFRIDGTFVASLPVRDLLASPAAERGDLQYLDLTYLDTPAAPETPLRVIAKDLDCSARNACFTACNDAYWDCIESGTCFPQIICDECEDQLTYCQQTCPACVCTDPKSVTYRYDTFLIGGSYSGYQQCYEDMFQYDFQEGHWYAEYVWVYQRNQVQVTTYCNGTTSEQVVGVSYIYSPCYVNTYLTCYFPFSWPPSTC